MPLDRPIFIIGAGRSGSTAFHSIFTEHPQVSWLTGFLDREPEDPSLNQRWMRAIDLPVVGARIRKRLFRGEFYNFWEHHCRGFRRPFRDLTAADVTPRIRRVLPRVLAQVTIPARPRLAVKITGWPRVRFLKEVFPDALFVHVVRDGRAVANSSLNVDFWNGWLGPDEWGWGRLTPEQEQVWEASGQSFVALAGLQWNLFMDATDACREAAGESFFEVRYEEFCDDPVGAIRATTEFCGLNWSDGFEAAVRAFPVESRNDKWREDLSTEQQALLEEVTREHLARYGYLPGTS
jgi:hypothetical protein